MWASFLFEGIYPLIFGTPIISTADRVCNFGGYSWRHKYPLFCVRVSLVINITQPIHVCVKHRYPHLSTCPVWRFGHPSKLDIFQVHAALSSPKQNGLIISKAHHDKNLCFTSTSLRFHVATFSARFGRSDGGSKADFSFPLRISAFVNITSEHHPITSSTSLLFSIK